MAVAEKCKTRQLSVSDYERLSSRICPCCTQLKPKKGGTGVGKAWKCADCRERNGDQKKATKSREEINRATLERNRRMRQQRREEAAKMEGVRQDKLNAIKQREMEKKERADLRFLPMLNEVTAKLRSSDFRAWYEATTGLPVVEFIERLLTPGRWVTVDVGSGWRERMLERIRNAIEVTTERNPWTNPELRSFWCEQLHGEITARERRLVLMNLATPKWADREKVLAIYRERERLVRETGIEHDVDHIVPIVNKLVCGLHCEHNLRVIPASENRSKSNKFEI